jgi:hypothetical protein
MACSFTWFCRRGMTSLSLQELLLQMHTINCACRCGRGKETHRSICWWDIKSAYLTKNLKWLDFIKPITVLAWSKAWTVFTRSNAGIVDSNLTQAMDVCTVCLFCVCVALCVGRGLATGWSPVQGVLPTVYMIKKVKKRPGPNKML